MNSVSLLKEKSSCRATACKSKLITLKKERKKNFHGYKKSVSYGKSLLVLRYMKKD